MKRDLGERVGTLSLRWNNLRIRLSVHNRASICPDVRDPVVDDLARRLSASALGSFAPRLCEHLGRYDT